MDLEVYLPNGMRLEQPVMLGAGPCKLFEGPEGVRAVSRSMASAITIGSITYEPREGNSGNVFWDSDLYSLNSMGLPNRGAAFYRNNLSEMVKIIHETGKKCIVSVAGFSAEQYGELSNIAVNSGADMVEINMSCPNIRDGGRIGCFNPNYVSEVLQVVLLYVGGKRVSLKISPFSDDYARRELLEVIKESGIKTVVASNTFPDAVAYFGGKNAITANKNGFAGLSGPAVKPIALGQIIHIRAILTKADGFMIPAEAG